MTLFHELEKRIDEKLRGLFRSASSPQQGRELIEIQRSILDQISERVQMLPRARRVFPYNDVSVRIAVADPERRIALEMVFVGDGGLEQTIREYLRRDNVEFPEDLRATVTLYDTTEIADPIVVCRRLEKETAPSSTRSAPPAAPPAIRFTFLSSGKTLDLAQARIQIGRLPEVLDDRRRPVRRNDLTIDDSTVSRAHAHIEWAAASGEYRIYDDGSSYGTGVSHSGKLINVPAGSGRGVRLQPGDELYLGQARIRIDSI